MGCFLLGPIPIGQGGQGWVPLEMGAGHRPREERHEHGSRGPVPKPELAAPAAGELVCVCVWGGAGCESSPSNEA